MDDAAFALADARGVGLGEELGGGVDEWRPEVGEFAGIEEWFADELAVDAAQRGGKRMAEQAGVEVFDEVIGGSGAVFDAEDGVAEALAKGDELFAEGFGLRGVTPGSQAVLCFGGGDRARRDEPALDGVEVGEELGWALGEDWFCVDEVEDGPVADEEKSVDPLCGIRGGGCAIQKL